MSFTVPKDYTDFVSNKEALLKEIKVDADFQNDFCLLELYFGEKLDLASVLRKKLELQEDIDRLIICSGDEPYIWHHGQRLELVVATVKGSDELFLAACVRYGDYIDDEWFLTYLALSLTKKHPLLFARITDNDGEFLLIEAADYLDDWIGPENSLHRIWIVQGQVHIIPFDYQGSALDVNLPISASLVFLRSMDVSLSIANKQIQKSIQSKTVDIYPERTSALMHHIVAIVPKWASLLAERSPSVIGAAVFALSSIEADKISKTVQNVVIGDNDSLSPISLRMTKAQYAQLTFKQFKVPRKYHPQMRRMTQGNSAKIAKAYDLGCRILCGLELAVATLNDKLPDILHTREVISNNVHNYLLAQELLHLKESIDGQFIVINEDVQQKTTSNIGASEYLSAIDRCIFNIQPTIVEVINNVTYDSQKEKDDTEIFSYCDEQLFEVIKQGHMRWDSDDWLYLTPEEFDKRINNIADTERMKFSTNAESDNNSDEKNGDFQNSLTPISHGNSDEALQNIVDGFKNFLLEKSDIDGVTSSIVKGPRKSTKKKEVTASRSDPKRPISRVSKFIYSKESFSGEGFGGQLNMDYLNQVIESANNLLVNISADTVPIAYTGVAEKVIDNANQQKKSAITGSDDESAADSDDVSESGALDSEDEENSGDDEDTNDANNGFYDEHEDGLDEDDLNLAEKQFYQMREGLSEELNEGDEEFYSMEDIQRAMDSELMDEDAFMNTFMKHGQNNFDPSNLNEEDLDSHFLSNFLNAHAEGLGVPVGPFQQILSQLGLEPPRPPPSNA